MKVLYIGDIMGEPGRRAVGRMVPRLVSQRQIDIVIGNGENAAGGLRDYPRAGRRVVRYGVVCDYHRQPCVG